MYRIEKPEPIEGDKPKENTEKFITKENLNVLISDSIQKLIDEGVIEWKQ